MKIQYKALKKFFDLSHQIPPYFDFYRFPGNQHDLSYGNSNSFY